MEKGLADIGVALVEANNVIWDRFIGNENDTQYSIHLRNCRKPQERDRFESRYWQPFCCADRMGIRLVYFGRDSSNWSRTLICQRWHYPTNQEDSGGSIERDKGERQDIGQNAHNCILASRENETALLRIRGNERWSKWNAFRSDQVRKKLSSWCWWLDQDNEPKLIPQVTGDFKVTSS